MNKEKIIKELNEWATSEYGSDFEVVIDCDDLTLLAEGVCVAWFINFKKDKFHFAGSNDCNLNDRLIQEDIIKKFYDKAIEVLYEHEQKYTVQVFPSEYGFLYKRDGDINDLITKDLDRCDQYRENNFFTQSEIKKLKQRDNVAIDWNKAIIEEVGKDEK